MGELRKIRTVNETEGDFINNGSAGLRCVSSDTEDWLYFSQDGTKVYKVARQSYRFGGSTYYVDNVMNDLELFGELYIPEYIRHAGDSDTHIRFNPDLIRFYANNSMAFSISNNEIYMNEDRVAGFSVVMERDDALTNPAITLAQAGTGNMTIEQEANGVSWFHGPNPSFFDRYVLSKTSNLSNSIMYWDTHSCVLNGDASGGNVTFQTNNLSNTANSHGIISPSVASATAGNPLIRFLINGVANGSWVFGVDNVDNDSLKFSRWYNDYDFSEAHIIFNSNFYEFGANDYNATTDSEFQALKLGKGLHVHQWDGVNVSRVYYFCNGYLNGSGLATSKENGAIIYQIWNMTRSTGAVDWSLRLTNTATAGSQPTQNYRLIKATLGAVEFNDGAEDIDFIVKDDSGAESLKIDAGTGIISIQPTITLNPITYEAYIGEASENRILPGSANDSIGIPANKWGKMYAFIGSFDNIDTNDISPVSGDTITLSGDLSTFIYDITAANLNSHNDITATTGTVSAAYVNTGGGDQKVLNNQSDRVYCTFSNAVPNSTNFYLEWWRVGDIVFCAVDADDDTVTITAPAYAETVVGIITAATGDLPTAIVPGDTSKIITGVTNAINSSLGFIPASFRLDNPAGTQWRFLLNVANGHNVGSSTTNNIRGATWSYLLS